MKRRKEGNNMIPLTKKRLNYIDSIKGFGIWLVVLGHLLDPGNYLKSYIYGFHMPLFFSVYGMTYKCPESVSSLAKRIIKRFFSYGVTYFIWALIYCQFNIRNFLLVMWGTNDSLIYAKSSGVLWFLPCYFISCVIFEIVMFFFINKKNGIFITFGLFSFFAIAGCLLGIPNFISYRLPWGIDIALIASLFLWFGYFFKNIFLPMVLKKKAAGFILIPVCAVVCVLSIFVKTQNGYVRMASGDYGNFPVFLLTAISGSLFISLIIFFLDKISIVSKVLSSLGQYSLVIMVLQRDVTNFYQSYIPSKYDLTIVAVICSVIITALLYVASYIISNLLPFMAGKYKNISIKFFRKKITIIK